MSCLAECTKDSSLIGLTGYGGADIPVKGTCKMPCSYKDNHVDAEFYVMETNSRTILSLKTCKQQNLVKFLHSLKPIHATTGRPMEEIKEQYENVFQGLGKLEQSYHMKMDPKAVPVAQSPRKIPATLRGKLEKNSTGWKQMRSLPKSINPQNGYIIQLLWKKTMENSECVWTLESSTSI